MSSEFANEKDNSKSEWLDDDDLDLKYNTKPTQREAIRKNAEKWWDGVRECWLYKDTKHTGEREHGTSHVLKRSSTTTQHEKNAYKPMKKPKLDADNGPAKEETSAEAKLAAKAERDKAAAEKKKTKEEAAQAKLRKPLSDAQTKKLDKLRDALDKANNDGEAKLDCMDKTPSIAAEIPARIPKDCRVCNALVLEHVANIDLAKTPGWIGNGKKVIDEAGEALEQAIQLNEKFQRWIDDSVTEKE